MSKKEEGVEFVKWFAELSNKSIQVAGGKGASLAEMYNSKFPIPPGFVVTAEAYAYFIEKAGIKNKIDELLEGLDVEDTLKLEEVAKEIRELISKTAMPDEMSEAISEAYEILDVDREMLQEARGSALEILKKSREPPFVAVRSSATTEDLAEASFAGQQETFLNVKGRRSLLRNVRKCFASLFTARAVYYRTKKGFKHEGAKLAVVVQKMIDSDKSGVMFSKNPVADDNNIVIEAVWGLGEGIVSGRIKPDYYKVSSDLSDFKILDMKIAEKKSAVVRNSAGETTVVELSEAKRNRQVLNEREIKILAGYAKKLEEHYKKPQDIEFAILGEDICIVQSRPITTSFSSSAKKNIEGNELLTGLGASPGISSGKVKIVKSMSDLGKIRKGDVLVTEMTNPDMVVSMQKAAAIVTDEGGITSHAAIISREMGIPAVVGTGNATSLLKEEQEVTVDGSSGKVYGGRGETKLEEIRPAVLTKTKIKIIVDLPEAAPRAAKTGLKAAGLIRLEGIIAKSGRHPLYFVDNNKSEEYVKLLFEGLKKIAEYFDDMWIRTSDLRSDEFWNLEGAPKEKEGNPMLGNHGVRFSLKHVGIHEAELKAVKKLAGLFANKKFGIMIPQVISVEEVKETKTVAKEIEMPENVKIGIMVETPAAVQIINNICDKGIDFVSFGTNDLTQYMLAIDRNNPNVQDLFNEMNPAVISALSYVIRRCRKYGVETSICGQAGSKEEMVRFLISEGIDSISVNADSAEKVSKIVASLESGNQVQEIEAEEAVKSSVSEEKKEDESKINGANLGANLGREEVTKDIEEVILQELGDEGPQDGAIGDEENYSPGNLKSSRNRDVPSLNDVIQLALKCLKK